MSLHHNEFRIRYVPLFRHAGFRVIFSSWRHCLEFLQVYATDAHDFASFWHYVFSMFTHSLSTERIPRTVKQSYNQIFKYFFDARVPFFAFSSIYSIFR